MSDPTPGPWRVVVQARLPNCVVQGPQGESICAIHFDLNGRDMTEGLANAQAIVDDRELRTRIEKLATEITGLIAQDSSPDTPATAKWCPECAWYKWVLGRLKAALNSNTISVVH